MCKFALSYGVFCSHTGKDEYYQMNYKRRKAGVVAQMTAAADDASLKNVDNENEKIFFLSAHVNRLFRVGVRFLQLLQPHHGEEVEARFGVSLSSAHQNKIGPDEYAVCHQKQTQNHL